MERREFVMATGAATAIGLAGCIGGSDGESSAEDAVEVYWKEGDEDVIHSESQLDANDGDGDGEHEEFDPEFVEATVEAEDIDSDELDDEGFSASELDDDDIDDLAEDEEVALVELVSEVDGDELPEYWLAATDDGDWYVLDLASQSVGF